MYLNSLRPSQARISIGLLLAGVCAAPCTKLPGQASANPIGTQSRAPAADVLEGLPPFLVPVPGGTVQMGLTAQSLIGAASQVVSPTRPQMAARIASKQLQEALGRSASLLGQRKVDVATFLLGQTPVTSAQWDSYLNLRRQRGEKVRPPFHWWKVGCPDDYAKALPEIQKQFPKDPLGPVLYWERHGPNLPYALRNEKGESIANLPVSNIDYREANEFAAFYGMRLPTEAEFTRAARGDGTNLWPWGKADPAADVFSEDALKQLKLFNTSDKVLKPAGAVPGGTGPFGHTDMFGQVWQIVTGLEYRPINGPDAFASEWKALQKDKVGAMLECAPVWRDNRVICKGGSYLSGGEPIQLLIDARANLQTIEVFDSIGLRLAKTPKPGYDILYSLLRGSYSRGAFGPDQDIDLSSQVGAERYELAADGFPTAYHVVSFATVNGLTNERSGDLGKLLDKSHMTPLLLGTFVTTTPLLDPAVPAGHYSVLYRKDGMPRELQEAMKAGHRELAAMKKSKPKATEPTEDDKGKESEKKGSWREVISRFGITEKDIEASGTDTIKFVRIDGIEVTTERDCFLLHGNEGKIVAAIPATNKKLAYATPFANELVFEADAKGKAVAKFRIGVPVQIQNNRKVTDVHFHVTLDRPMPGDDAPWRMPAR